MSRQEASSLWSFVPLEEYSVPAAPAAERVRSGFGRLWDRLRGSGAAADDGARVGPEAPPAALLEQAAPWPSWSGAVAALDAALGPWAEGGGSPEDNVRVVVGPSGAADDEVVRAWADSRRWPIVGPPPIEQILAGGEDWLAGMVDDEAPRAITRLDRFYLRHHNGLALVERLIERLRSSRGPVLVGCGSWSWAYLNRAIEADVMLGKPLAIQALDHRRLGDWFGRLAGGSFEFRQSSDGESAVVVAAGRHERATPDDGADNDADFLSRLAAFSRGIPLVAWQGWRDSLRLASEKPTGETGNQATIWLPGWPQLDFPGPRGVLTPCALAVLHELLLQGSATAELLALLLPYSTSEITNSLHALRKSRLLDSDAQQWHVTRLGYPAVRSCLHEAGHLTGVI